MPHVLIVEDNQNDRLMLAELIERSGLSTSTAESLEEAKSEMKLRQPDALFVDLRLPDGSAFDLLLDIRAKPKTRVILMCDDSAALEVVSQSGSKSLRCLVKPIDEDQVKPVLDEVVRSRKPRRGGKKADLFGPMIGQCESMSEVNQLIANVAPTDATVLIVGESGTGKELVARSIHDLSHRQENRFIAMNCGAIPENLVESELFGHEKGAFTGANRSHRGVFERANHGTLFLDEITEMSPELQVRLLRVLETQSVRRVGGDKEISVDVRLIAATNRDPAEAVRRGRIRHDLLYRLSVFPITLPPLRERDGDIVLLAEHFLSLFNAEHQSSKTLTESAYKRLREYHWPGNIRQLRNVIERSFIMEDDTIDVVCLDNYRASRGIDLVLKVPAEAPVSESDVQLTVGTSISNAEQQLVEATLEYFGGDKQKTADVLGISLKTLYNRLNEYDQEQST